MRNAQYNDLFEYMRKEIKRYRIIIFALAAIFGLLGFMYGTLKSPRYTVKASVLISDNSGQGSGVLSLMSRFSLGNLLSGSASVDNEIMMLTSHQVFQDMVADLGLNTTYIVKEGIRKKFQYPVAPVMMDCNPAIADTISTSLLFNIKVSEKGLVDIVAKNSKKQTIGETRNASLPLNLTTDYGTFNFFFSDKYEAGKKLKEVVSFTNYSYAAEDYQRLVKVAIANKRADAINLSIDHVDPELGKLILSDLIQFYNYNGSLEKKTRGEATIKFLDDRIAQIIGQLGETETYLSDYKRKNNLSTIEADVEYNFTEHAALQAQITTLESQLEVLKVISAQLSHNNYDELLSQSAVTENVPNLSWMIGNYNGLIMRRRELAKTAKEGNFALTKLDEEIATTRDNVKTSLLQAQDQINASLAELQKKDNVSKSRIGSIPTQEKDLREVIRNQEIQEEIYVFLLQQREQQAMSSLNSLPRAIVIDRPYMLSKPAGMGRFPLAIIGIFGALFMSLMLIYFKYLLKIINF